MAWLVRLSPDGDAELVISELWDLGTSGVAEAGGSDGSKVLIAGFDAESDAVAAAARFDGTVERYDPDVWIPPEPRDVAVGDHTLRITPGRAFGHGEHPTTRLLLDALVARPPTSAVLDVGCGTGVLSIAAAVLGATSVTAVDIDAEAVEATLANARDNAALATVPITVELGGPPDGVRFATLVANLLVADLRRAARGIESALGTDAGSRLLVSGFLEHQEAEVQMLFPDLEVAEQWRSGEWVALDLRRR
ncbi:MAG: 50S ribosomal protein L11 methyltransferase [Acidimicrobiales bacterium]